MLRLFQCCVVQWALYVGQMEVALLPSQSVSTTHASVGLATDKLAVSAVSRGM